MRLIIFTNRDLASNLFLNHILPQIGRYVVHIFVSDKVGKATSTPPPKALKDLKFFEQTLINDFIFPLLDVQNRVYTEGGKLMTFNELSLHYAIPIESLNDIRSTENLDKVKNLQPDWVLSVRYGKIFGKAFLQIPKHGVINLHSGRLPQYRGVLPTFRALMNGDAVLYPTLHLIDNNTIDTGGVLAALEIEADKNKSLLWNILNLYPKSAPLVAAKISQIIESQQFINIFTEQNESNAAYFTFPTEEEITTFSEKTKINFVDTEDYSELLKLYI